MVQELPSEVGGMFSTPAYWRGTVPNVGLQNMIYTIGAGDTPKTFALFNGLIQTPPASVASNFTFGFPGGSPVISANGTTSGILWAINSSANPHNGLAILYAFDATNLAELYDSTQFSSDNPGPAVKFTVPTVANGSVYVGTQTQIAVSVVPRWCEAESDCVSNTNGNRDYHSVRECFGGIWQHCRRPDGREDFDGQ
jgi:hypothetical protein